MKIFLTILLFASTAFGETVIPFVPAGSDIFMLASATQRVRVTTYSVRTRAGCAMTYICSTDQFVNTTREYEMLANTLTRIPATATGTVHIDGSGVTAWANVQGTTVAATEPGKHWQFGARSYTGLMFTNTVNQEGVVRITVHRAGNTTLELDGSIAPRASVVRFMRELFTEFMDNGVSVTIESTVPLAIAVAECAAQPCVTIPVVALDTFTIRF